MLACGAKHFSMIWDVAGGGAFAVIPYDKLGKQTDPCLVTGHKGAVLDLDYNPFNDDLVASVSEDCNVYIWGIPEGCPGGSITAPLQTLHGHKRKVGTCDFHPCANNVLATTSSDTTLKLWDIEQGENMFTCEGFTDVVNSVSFNKDGSQICSTCKDKKLRIFDPRQQSIVADCQAHMGAKGTRCCWITDKDLILTTGFSRQAEREMAFWDPRNLAQAINRHNIDTQSGILMPFYDPDTSLLYLVGRGDSSISYYELVGEKPCFYSLNTYMSSNAQSGCGMIPKRICNTSTCEIARLLKVTKTSVNPVTFCVPRKSELFQDDIFPDTFSGNPSLTAAEWKEGQNKDPDCTHKMSEGFVAKEKKEFKPVEQEVEKEKTPEEIKAEWQELKKKFYYL
jgi:coronin-1B/1C/6